MTDQQRAAIRACADFDQLKMFMHDHPLTEINFDQRFPEIIDEMDKFFERNPQLRRKNADI